MQHLCIFFQQGGPGFFRLVPRAIFVLVEIERGKMCEHTGGGKETKDIVDIIISNVNRS